MDRDELKAHVVAHVVSQGIFPTAEAADAMTASLFESLDVDHDGRVTSTEWVRAFVASEMQKRQGKGDQPLVHGDA